MMALRVVTGLLLSCSTHALRSQSGAGLSKRLRLIGTGHQRTGTESLTAALMMLGYNPAHGSRLIPRKPFADPFTGAIHHAERETIGSSLLEIDSIDLGYRLNGSLPLSYLNATVLAAFSDVAANHSDTESAVQTLLDNGFDSTTPDFPINFLQKDLIARYPEAKVINLRHPGGGMAWAESMTNLCWNCSEGLTGYMANLSAQFSSCTQDLMKYGEAINQSQREACAAEYDRENEEIEDLVPPEQLLIFHVTSGWKPLCKFLGVAEPNAPFPKVSSYGSRRRHVPTQAELELQKRRAARREAAEKAAAEKAALEKAAVEKAAAEKAVAAEKAAAVAEKEAAEKAAEKAKTEKVAPEASSEAVVTEATVAPKPAVVEKVAEDTSAKKTVVQKAATDALKAAKATAKPLGLARWWKSQTQSHSQSHK